MCLHAFCTELMRFVSFSWPACFCWSPLMSVGPEPQSDNNNHKHWQLLCGTLPVIIWLLSGFTLILHSICISFLKCVKNLRHLRQNLITLTRVSQFVCTHCCCYETKKFNTEQYTHRSREPLTAPGRRSSITLLDTRFHYLDRCEHCALALKCKRVPTKTKPSREAVSVSNKWVTV